MSDNSGNNTWDESFDQSVINISIDETPKKKHHGPRELPTRRKIVYSPKPEHKKKQESIIEWFDRSVEDELHKRRYDSSEQPELPEHSGGKHAVFVDSTASNVDVQAGLRGERDTELYDAVDKFAKAEAIVAFEGAVRAAETAAANAPPELAEEAAVAGAKGYQAELTTVVKQKVPGVKPIEVIGYVGVTRPKFAAKRV
ncbi:PREDICTED: uncharacterized protein LOC108568212 [Nicrophorus vespilloides]|uniref:Uncharacterized protein LOC108568212 n=1 Tax=Nicrophorus vespilloides TaxID=110193 RepID=A0ABM1NCU9_NICVS|nr:PREDICTED: uncharacterized protein LOC108568212 [Nicrophorus vespilloides]